MKTIKLNFFICSLVILTACFCINPATAIISNGMNSTDLLGQFDDVNGTILNYTTSAINDGAGGVNSRGFDIPTDILIDTVNHRLFVSESGNNRVLVYNLDVNNNLADRIADNVLGQANFTSSATATTQSGMNNPSGLVYDATNNRLFVADTGNHRVLIFDVTAITNGENAVNVLGQADFISGGSATTQSRMFWPSGLVYDAANNRLFVADYNNSRVLVYDVTAIVNGENAVNVLGEPDFTSVNYVTTQSGMTNPEGLDLDTVNNRLFVADNGNARVLVFDVTAITNGENAINVLGQANFTSSGTATTQPGMNYPYGLSYDQTYKRLFVSEEGNNRVLVFDVAAITNGENAVNVLGQANFTTGTSSTSQSRMSDPSSLHFDAANNRLYVCDSANNRVLIYGGAQPPQGAASPALFFGGF